MKNSRIKTASTGKRSEDLSKPKVSVIIPVYNVEKYLDNCLNSVLKQTLKELEVICVNDGSTDRSLDILNRFAAKDARLRIITQSNAGAGAARNTGVAQARGEYIGFVDSDDVLYPTMYEKLYSKAAAVRAEMVITGEIETTTGENIKFPVEGTGLSAEELSLSTFRAIEYPSILGNVFLWNRIYLRDFWIKHKIQIPEKRKFAEDMLCCTQTSVLAGRIAYVKGPLYQYRNVREDSLSYTLAKTQDKLDYIKAISETKEFLLQTGQYPFFRNSFLMFAIHIYAMLQQKMTNYDYLKKFILGVAEVLDEDDIAEIKGSWLYASYPEAISALESKKCGRLYLKNRIQYLL